MTSSPIFCVFNKRQAAQRPQSKLWFNWISIIKVNKEILFRSLPPQLESKAHLDQHAVNLVLRRFVHVGRVADHRAREERRGLCGEEDDDVCEGGDEGDAPDGS